jgi:hypothetical protein
MAAHGEIWRPSVGTFDGRQWGDSHGHRQVRGGQPTAAYQDDWFSGRWEGIWVS